MSVATGDKFYRLPPEKENTVNFYRVHVFTKTKREASLTFKSKKRFG